MANDRPLYITLGQLARIPDADFVDPGAGVQHPNGSAVAPSCAFNTNHGIFYDATNTGPGLSVAGAQIGWLNASGLTISIVGGGLANIVVQGEGSTPTFSTQKFSADANGANNQITKGRGLIASKAVPVLNDVLGVFSIAGWNGSAPTNACRILGTLIETGTVGPAAMGGRLSFSCAAIGAGSQTEIGRFEAATGFSMYGANPVIDANRTLIPGSSTVAGLPAVVTSGLRNVSDLEGGQGTVFGGNSLWRNQQNGQVAQSTVSGAGVLSKMTGYFNFAQRAIVNNTMQKLSDAGLLAKLLGLWVHAVPTNSTDALQNWITPGTRLLTNTGAIPWAANQGFTGDGAHILDSVSSVATFGGSQNNFAMGTYVRAAGTGSALAVIGQSTASARGFYLQSFTSGALTARMMDGTNDTFTPGQYTGMFVLSRAASANYQASVNDAAAATVSRTSTAVTNRAISFLGTTDTTGSEFSNAQISFSFLATALTSTDIANLRAILVDYYLVQIGAATATVASLPPAANFQGQTYYVPDLGGSAALLESDGTNWFRTGFDGYEARSTSTGSETLTYLTNAGNVEYTATLLGNLTVTLSGTDAKGATVKKGAEFALTLDQPAPGIFTFTVKDGPSGNTLITFPVSTNKAALFVFNGTNWRLKMDSSL